MAQRRGGATASQSNFAVLTPEAYSRVQAAPLQQQTYVQTVGAPADALVQHYGEQEIDPRSPWALSEIGKWALLIIILVLFAVMVPILLFGLREEVRENGTLIKRTASVCGFATTINKLPYVMKVDGRSYRLGKNLVWAEGDTPALLATGRNMKLCFDGHSIKLTNQSGQGLLVVGTAGVFGPDAERAASLTVYDAWFYADTFLYPVTAYAMTVETNGQLTVEHGEVRNVAYGIQNFNGYLMVRDFNYTAHAIEDHPDRIAAFEAGLLTPNRGACSIWSEGSTDTNLFHIRTHIDKTLLEGVPEFGPLIGAGPWHFHNPAPGFITSNPGRLQAEDVQTFADFGFIILRANHIYVRNVFTEAPLNPYPMGQVGMVVGCGNNSNGYVQGVDVNGRNFGAGSSGVLIVASQALYVTDVTISGRSSAGLVFVDDFLPPHVAHWGLLAFDLFDNSLNQTGITVNNFQITALSGDTYGITVGNDAVSFTEITGYEPCNPESRVVLRNGNVHGGAAGLVVGENSGRRLSVTDTVFGESNYGVYVKPGARNVRLVRNMYSQHCVGLYTETGGSGPVVSRDSDFMSNEDNVNNGIAANLYLSNNILTTEGGGECELPDIYDVCTVELSQFVNSLSGNATEKQEMVIAAMEESYQNSLIEYGYTYTPDPHPFRSAATRAEFIRALYRS